MDTGLLWNFFISRMDTTRQMLYMGVRINPPIYDREGPRTPVGVKNRPTDQVPDVKIEFTYPSNQIRAISSR